MGICSHLLRHAEAQGPAVGIDSFGHFDFCFLKSFAPRFRLYHSAIKFEVSDCYELRFPFGHGHLFQYPLQNTAKLK